MEKIFDWDREKNIKLIRERGISFEMIVSCVERDEILAIIQNKKKYEHQEVYIVEIDQYVYAVPFVEDDKKIFLKTIIPSRKLTKQYLKK